MIVKFSDIYLSTNLSPESTKHFIEKYLEEHIRENSDLDLEHFVEVLEESEKFEVVDEELEFELEYTQEEIDTFVDNVFEEEFLEPENEDEEDEDEDYYEDNDEEDEDY